MAQEKIVLKDKRKHYRYKRKLAAQLRVSFTSRYSAKIIKGIDNIIALAETNNISIDGMSLHIVGSPMDSKKSLSPKNAVHIVGRPIEIRIDNGKIAIWGDVIRTDAKTLELAIVIYKVSDEKHWKKICAGYEHPVFLHPH
ncbi:MAG TPA: hypothetical protein VMU10_03670 [Desulfomonilia bacterium]|nr:hypothetical protein [Desulfomonilia bacterium]